MYTLAVMVILVVFIHPLISSSLVVPYIQDSHYMIMVAPIAQTASNIITFMLGLLFVLPLVLMPIYKRFSVKQTSLYMSGENTGDDESFYGSQGKVQKVELRNWYMNAFFGDEFWLSKTIYIGGGILIAGLFALLGGFFIA
jgi:ech hydrogenase subunit A